MTHLFEKIADTTPGKWSNFLRELHYNHGHELKADIAKKLLACSFYLEELALAEIKKEIPQWVIDLQEREKRCNTESEKSNEPKTSG